TRASPPPPPRDRTRPALAPARPRTLHSRARGAPMAESFPTTPRASSAIRVAALALGLAAIGLATRNTITSSDWLGRPFPGLMLGFVAWVRRPGGPLVHSLLAVGMAGGIFLITAMDLYGPATFFRLHVLCEALVPPAVLHLALLFPQPHRFARWRLAGYAPAL